MVTNVFTGATNANFATATNWSQGTKPVAGDGFVTTFNASSPNCTINAASACNAIDFTLYTNTITWTNNITVSGAVTFGSGQLGSSTTKGIVYNSSATSTSNGLSIPFLLSFGTFTITLGDNHTTTGGVTTTGTPTLNSNTLNINGGTLTMTNGMVGTSTLNFGTTGNPTWTGTGSLDLNTTINTSGTLTLSGTVVFGGAGTPTLTWTAGAVTVTSSTLQLTGSCTLATSGMAFNTVQIIGSVTITLNSTLSATQLILSGTGSTWAGSAGFNVGTLTQNNTGTFSTVLHSTNTYTVTTAINITGVVGGVASYSASTTSSSALLNYSGTTANQNILYASFTDINASGGNTLYDYIGGTLTRTNNITIRAQGSYAPQASGGTVAYCAVS